MVRNILISISIWVRVTDDGVNKVEVYQKVTILAVLMIIIKVAVAIIIIIAPNTAFAIYNLSIRKLLYFECWNSFYSY